MAQQLEALLKIILAVEVPATLQGLEQTLPEVREALLDTIPNAKDNTRAEGGMPAEDNIHRIEWDDESVLPA